MYENQKELLARQKVAAKMVDKNKAMIAPKVAVAEMGQANRVNPPGQG